jgi:two-component system, NtrC family, response regulator AtoC
VLARHFIAKFGKVTGKQVRDLSDGSLTKLMSYQWPGNVRELENVMERALILAQHELIDESDLDFGSRPMSFSDTMITPMSPSGALTQHPNGQQGEGLTGILEDMERRRLVEAMNKHHGRKAEAARDLGINRSTLYYRLKKYGLLSEE